MGPALRRYLHLEYLAENGDRPPAAEQLQAAWDRLSADEVRWLRVRPAVPEESSGHEVDRRHRKAAAIADALAAAGRGPEEAARMSWAARDRAAARAGQHLASEQTWRLVVEMLRGRVSSGPGWPTRPTPSRQPTSSPR